MSTALAQPIPAARLHAMDALRAATMLTVVVLHASVSYMTVRMPDLLWAVHDGSTSTAFDWLFWCIQGFCMPVFFFLAGFCAAQQCAARGPRAFLINRTRRILGPLVVGSLIFLPITFYVWAYGWLVTGQCTVREILRVRFGDDIQHNLYGPAHLWFLEYLFLYCVVYWGVQRWWNLRRHTDSHRIRWYERLLVSPWRPLFLAVPSALILCVHVDAAINFHNSFVPDPGRLLYYGVFFAGGTWYCQSEGFDRRGKQLGGIYLTLSLPLLVLMGMLLREQLAHPLTGAARVAVAGSVAVFAWLCVFGGLGLCLRFCDRERLVVRYLSDASYWIYLCHFPVVGVLQVMLFHVSAPAAAKVLIVSSAALAFGVLSYQSFVRYTFIGALLNGSRRSPVTPLGGSERGNGVRRVWSPTLSGHHARYDLATVAAVDPEVVVGGEHDGISEDFGHTHQTSIGQTHRNIGVLLQEPENRAQLAGQVEVDVKETTPQQAEHRLPSGCPDEKERL